MTGFTRQLFSTLAPFVACLTVYACAHSGPQQHGASRDQAVLLLPKISSLDEARISMLATQKARYVVALHGYQIALSQATVNAAPDERAALHQTLLNASKEYGFVAQETADSAFRASGLPRTLPGP